MGLLCLYFSANAQDYKPIHPLKPGDSVPAITIKNVMNFRSDILRLSDFKGKIVILDFWATWCSSCLNHFAEADSIQKNLSDKIQIILVNTSSTRDTRNRIAEVMKRFEPFTLPTVVSDTVLDKMFPHFSLPHYVWIDQRGVVRLTTSGEELTLNNVYAFINDNKLPFYQKVDFNPRRPLYTVDDLPLNSLAAFSILLKGKIDGIDGGGIRKINDTARGVILHNRSLYSIYQAVLFNVIPGFSDNRIILQVKDPSKIRYTGTGLSRDEWERQNFYSYERIVPAAYYHYVYNDVLDDLNKNTAYFGRFENRIVKCWILKKSGKNLLFKTTGGEYTDSLKDPKHPVLKNAPLLSLIEYISKITANSIVLDKTGYKQNTDLVFQYSIRNIKQLKRALKAYGLTLCHSQRRIKMLVVRDKISTNTFKLIKT